MASSTLRCRLAHLGGHEEVATAALEEHAHDLDGLSDLELEHRGHGGVALGDEDRDVRLPRDELDRRSRCQTGAPRDVVELRADPRERVDQSKAAARVALGDDRERPRRYEHLRPAQATRGGEEIGR